MNSIHPRILFSLLLVIVSSAVHGQSYKIAETPEQAITYFFDGLAELNDAKTRAYVTPDFMLVENGVLWNMDTLSNAMSSMKEAEFSRKNSFRYERQVITGTSAWVVYHNQADIMYNGRSLVIRWIESALLVRDKSKGWRIQLMHSTKEETK